MKVKRPRLRVALHFDLNCKASLGSLFLLPVRQMQVLFDLATLVPVLHGLLWLTIRFAKRVLRIADGFSDDFEGFDHGSCRY